MKNKSEFELLPYHSNIFFSKKKNSLNEEVIIGVKETIKKIVKYCDVVLMQECENFKDFTGRDVDTFYISENKFLDIKEEENVILNQREEKSFRFLINKKDSVDFINLDIEDLDTFSPKTKQENKTHFNQAIECHKTGLKHLRLNSILYYKLVKYFFNGIVFSYEQLYKLKEKLNSLNDTDLRYILNLSKKFKKRIYLDKKIN